MSYARSPRAVCSTTIGTRFNARSFMIGFVSPDWVLRLAVGFVPKPVSSWKVIGASVTFGALHDPVDHLILEHHGLDLPHGLRVLLVRAARLLGIRIARRQLLDARLDALAVDRDALAP